MILTSKTLKKFQIMKTDVIIAFYISKSNVSNKYIGLSHLCCYGCSAFISALGFQFRGVNSKFEINSKSPKIDFHTCPEKINSVVNEFQLFAREVQKIKNFENIYSYDVQFNSSKQDICNHSSNLISDDICHFLNYCKNYNTSEFAFGIKMEDLNRIENIIPRFCVIKTLN
jgi:hypothetical protein